MKHPVPREALDDRLGWIGTSGSGKTYNAGTAVEIILSQHGRIVGVDPLGVWWGLRLLADGKTPSKFDVVIFGGPHGDLPLNEHAGALIGETVVSMAESCIIDLSELRGKAAERRFMTAFLDTIYQKASKEPFHLVVDEADLFAPQMPAKGAETLLGHMEDIVRRGRVKGFIPWLITQRPAVINKNVLSQVDGLLAFKLTSSQDRDALDAWIEGQADKAKGKEIKASLPTLQIGQGVVWIPGRGILTTASFPQKITFDSSRTPKRGEKLKSRKLKPLDVDKLKVQLAEFVEQQKTNDIPTLKRRIAELDAAAKKAQATPAAKPMIDKQALQEAEQRGFEQARKKLARANERELKKRVGDALKTLRDETLKFADVLKLAIDTAREQEAKAADITFTPPGPQQTPAKAATTPARVAAVPPARKPSPDAGGDGVLTLRAERKPLGALVAVYPAGMTEAQWAVAAGLKRKGGTWGTYLSRLRTAGCIEKRGDEFFATEIGIAAAGDSVQAPPPPGPELLAFWKSKISGVGPMLDALAAHYPNAMTREDLATVINLAVGGGTFGTYVSRLRSPGLIEVDGPNIRCSPSLMGAA